MIGLRETITGKSWENLWFPVDFPFSQPIDVSDRYLIQLPLCELPLPDLRSNGETVKIRGTLQYGWPLDRIVSWPAFQEDISLERNHRNIEGF